MAVYQDLKSTKDGRSWYFKTYKDGKQIKSKKYRTKKEAIDEEALFILKRDLPYNKNFSLVAKDYFNNLTKIRKESTIYAYKKDYNNHIHDYFKNMNISSISIKNIREWAEILEKKGLSVCYMNKIHFILNKIFDFAISNYDLTSNPSKLYGTFKQKNDQIIKDEDKVRYITKDEFDKFISVIDDNFWKTFFMFLYYSGVRKGEALALTWEDFRNDEIVINKTLYSKIKGKYTITSTKTNKNRIIKLNKTMLEQLNNYKNEIMKYTDFFKKMVYIWK